MMQMLARPLIGIALFLAVVSGGNAQDKAPSGNGEAQYRLGPEDKVQIKVYEWRPSRDEIFEWTAFKADYLVSGSGSLSLPLLGDVPASGMTTTDLSRDIGERLRERMGLVAPPDVTVEVVKFRP